MSILNWFFGTQVRNAASAPESSGLGHVDATIPVMPPDRPRVKLASPPVSHAGNRKTERLERRELVYGVVRDAMTRAGLLAASYKFKVLSLDVAGLQYLIMMDLANRSAGETGRLAEIEALMAQSAKMRHGIHVTAVYWRVNEHVTAGLSPILPSGVPQAPGKAPEHHPRTSATPLVSVKQAASYQPLQQDEVAAFKRALASATPAVPLAASGEIMTSGRRNPTPPVEFEDTQLVSPDDRSSPLSGTQYGDLN